MPKKRAPQKSPSSVAKKWSKNLYLIVIDQEPLRKNAALRMQPGDDPTGECEGGMATVRSGGSSGVRALDGGDFWRMLTKIREVEAQVGQKEMLIAEVEMEMMFGARGGYGAAYQRVMKQREMPQKHGGNFADAPPPQEEGEWPGEDADAGEEDEEMILLRRNYFLSNSPACAWNRSDRLSDREYDRLLKEFRKNVLKKGKTGPQQPPPPNGSAFASAPRREVKPETGRIKELYRLLVRRLHPDLRADKDAEVSHSGMTCRRPMSGGMWSGWRCCWR